MRSKDANETEGSDAERLLLVDVAEARAVAATRQSDHSDDKDNEITVAMRIIVLLCSTLWATPKKSLSAQIEK